VLTSQVWVTQATPISADVAIDKRAANFIPGAPPRSEAMGMPGAVRRQSSVRHRTSQERDGAEPDV
jgi:hypothetical protein